jgi:hypothetical protein
LGTVDSGTASTVVGNDGDPGAIERLGRDRPIAALSDHNNYWLWGPGAHTGDVLVVVTRSRVRLDELFASVAHAL